MIFMNTWSLVLLFFSGVLLVFRSDATSVPNISIVSRLNFTSDVTILLDNTFNKSNGATISDHDNEKKIIKRDAVVHEYSTEENVNFHIELGFYGYCKLSLFIIIRIFFGIAIDGSKFKEIIKRPIGLAIAVFCNFLLIPLVSCSQNRMLNTCINTLLMNYSSVMALAGYFMRTVLSSD